MTNEQMAARLEERAATAKAAMEPIWIDEDDEAAVLAGAKALREVDELKAKWKREECAHCDERPGGHDGTIWCAECLNWWRQQHATKDAENALREVEQKDARIAELEAALREAKVDGLELSVASWDAGANGTSDCKRLERKRRERFTARIDAALMEAQ